MVDTRGDAQWGDAGAQTPFASISPTPSTRPRSRSPRTTGPTPDGVPVQMTSSPAKEKSPDRYESISGTFRFEPV